MATKKVLTWDDGFDDDGFLDSFLDQELTSPTLVKLISNAGSTVKGSPKKEKLIERTIKLVNLGKIEPEDILIEYIKSPRMWLSFKLGIHKETPKKEDPSSLLKKFGDAGWYGPIYDKLENSAYYIHITKIAEPLSYDEEKNEVTKNRYYRWSVVAKITSSYVALSWYGFGYREKIDKRMNQFPFWKYIPKIFDELQEMTKASWEHPDLYNLTLEKLWYKYLEDINFSESYNWGHIRIKAESSGVALNAKTSLKGPSEMNLKGLVALADALSESALQSLLTHNIVDFNSDLEKKVFVHESLRNSFLKTLIKDWGAMAYEFSLDRLDDDKTKKEKIFRAYCNFGVRQDLETEDGLQHLKCFADYGNSSGALKFLLQEMAGL